MLRLIFARGGRVQRLGSGCTYVRALSSASAAEATPEDRKQRPQAPRQIPGDDKLGRWYSKWRVSPRRMLGSSRHRKEFLPLLELASEPDKLAEKFLEFAQEHDPLPVEYLVLVRSFCEANVLSAASHAIRTFRMQYEGSLKDEDVKTVQEAINWEMLVSTARVNDKTSKFWLSCIVQAAPNTPAADAATLVFLERAVKSGEPSAAKNALKRVKSSIDFNQLAHDFFSILKERIPSYEERQPIYCAIAKASALPPAKNLVTSLVMAALDHSAESGLGMLEFLEMHRLFPTAEGELAVMKQLIQEGKEDICLAYIKGERFVVPPLEERLRWMANRLDRDGSKSIRRARYRPLKALAGFLAREKNFDKLRSLAAEYRHVHIFVPALKDLVAAHELAFTAELLQMLDFSKDQDQLWAEVVINSSVQLVRDGNAEAVAGVLDHISSSVPPAVRWKPVLPEGYFTRATQRMGEKENMDKWLYTPVLATLEKKGLVAKGKTLFDRVSDSSTPAILSKGLEAFQLISEGNLEAANAAVEEVRSLGGEATLRELRLDNRNAVPAFRFSDLLQPLMELALAKSDTQQALAIFDEMIKAKFTVHAAGKQLVKSLATQGRYDDAISVLKTLYGAGKFNATGALLVAKQAIRNGVDQETFEGVKAKMDFFRIDQDRWPAWVPSTE